MSAAKPPPGKPAPGADPCRLQPATSYRLTLYDLDGRLVLEAAWPALTGAMESMWNHGEYLLVGSQRLLFTIVSDVLLAVSIETRDGTHVATVGTVEPVEREREQ